MRLFSGWTKHRESWIVDSNGFIKKFSQLYLNQDPPFWDGMRYLINNNRLYSYQQLELYLAEGSKNPTFNNLMNDTSNGLLVEFKNLSKVQQEQDKTMFFTRSFKLYSSEKQSSNPKVIT